MTQTLRWPFLFSSFWVLQGIGWGTYALLWYLASFPIYEQIDAPLYVGVVRVGYYVGIGIAVTLMLRTLYRRLWKRGASLTALLTLSLVCSLFGSGTWLFLFEGVKWPLDTTPFSGAYGASNLWYFARPVVSNTIVLLAWSTLYFGIKYQRNLLVQQERTFHAESLAREAQIQMLRYQLNPHFLFNTLNTLLTLIGEDDDRAKQFVHELAGFLRYSLLDTDTHTVPLHEEIAVIRSFLSIEKLRYEENLQVKFDIDPASESMQIPPFLVQSLIENAIKHGRATGPTPLQVRLSTSKEGNVLRIDVTNTGRLPSSSSRSKHGGIGLKNVRKRLRSLYPTRHSFSLQEEDGWVHARVVIQDSGDEQSRRHSSGKKDGRDWARPGPPPDAPPRLSYSEHRDIPSDDSPRLSPSSSYTS
ncbi:hypothetical protein BSZ35_18555 [Salinibacter sp. 10B]|uniref:sensor histidine kinase n=1 Tax=Salinibacter sp. 10B TaxID=1923971 RepID=UPI000D2ACE0E|nr:histidine kinase [Salinibacter sp. 10B]PQJ26927.1 hypothetical protein BSZ35_18555 [Salinibacter sp. 10B]